MTEQEQNSRNDLHPWPTISAVLFDLDADTVIKLINLAGINIDLKLTREEAHSNNTRKREYLSRIATAYENLSDDKKLVVAWIVAAELTRKDEDLAERLNNALSYIGWKIESGRLTPENIPVQELFFPKGSQHAAYVEIRRILQTATVSVSIIDPYVDGTIFQMLATLTGYQIKVEILTAQMSQDFTLEARKFLAQYSNFSLEIRQTKEFHDRFIVIDQNDCYHVGASIKDAGNKVFMFSKLEDQSNIDSLKGQVVQSWNGANIIPL